MVRNLLAILLLSTLVCPRLASAIPCQRACKPAIRRCVAVWQSGAEVQATAPPSVQAEWPRRLRPRLHAAADDHHVIDELHNDDGADDDEPCDGDGYDDNRNHDDNAS